MDGTRLRWMTLGLHNHMTLRMVAVFVLVVAHVGHGFGVHMVVNKIIFNMYCMYIVLQ